MMDQLYDTTAHINGLREAHRIIEKSHSGYEGGNNDFCRGHDLAKEAALEVLTARIAELTKPHPRDDLARIAGRKEKA